MPAEGADVTWRNWMTDLLSAAAERFSLVITGSPTWGWRDRSAGVPAKRSGGSRWLRVVTESLQWAHGDWWTGNIDANVITGVAKPTVLDSAEWEEGPRRIRAEVMTLAPGYPCSPTDMITAELELPARWWPDLRQSLQAISAARTSRECVDAAQLADRIRRFGTEPDLSAVQWETVHGDLHWANLMQPQLAILDWEWWGCGPAGLDAATLYCYSLSAPATARRVHDTFRDILSAPQGAIAQLYACSRLLARTEHGDHPQLAPLLRRHGKRLARAL
ncbi:MAG: phosphotransferase [Nocardiopsaceae bacterium]|nr:phosphotransferase [Nocardiopsaceae bacterium]